MNPKIIEITAAKTLPIRHKVMWPNQPIEYVKLKNDNEGKHFGLYLNDQLISVISLFTVNNEVQFRKFATLKMYQGKGYGSILLKEIIQISKNEKIFKMWCNSRVNKTNYYAKFGMNLTSNHFIKCGIEYVIMEKKIV